MWSVGQTGNPYTVYVNMVVKSTDVNLLELTKWRLISFSMERKHDMAGTFTLEVFDSSWVDIEYELFIRPAEKGDVSKCPAVLIDYGYAGVNTLKSERYEGFIDQVTPKFDSNGVTYSITGRINNRYGFSRHYDTYTGKRISEIVEKVLEDDGYTIGYIEDTIPLATVHSSRQFEVVWERHGLTAVQFIQDILAPNAISNVDYSGGYHLYFDENGKANFSPIRWIKEGPASEQRTYQVYWHRMGDVINFNPSISLTSIYVTGGSGTAATTSIDPESKEVLLSEYDPSLNFNSEVSGDMFLYETNEHGYYSRILTSPAERKELIEARQKAFCETQRINSYDASLDIIGDPKIKIWKPVRILLFTTGGLLHYTSGLYFVTGATDSISASGFQTTLSLRRNGGTFGTDFVSAGVASTKVL
jgi:hypothetical protein